MTTPAERLLSEVVTVVDGYRELERRCRTLEQNTVRAEKFYSWAVDVETVAAMHGVSRYIVRRYIELGLIETHPNSSPAKFLVRGSTALTLDFKELKEEAKYMK